MEDVGSSVDLEQTRPFPPDHLADRMKMAATWSPAGWTVAVLS